ncbi:glucosaminidase domain-containing protein [Gottfriedia solisilvae]|uniref:glucosaminidase domain-containing protein n=1 Tax=Gottfriedia solisilvae TaxID=1516104 RepID=UPI003D2F4A41
MSFIDDILPHAQRIQKEFDILSSIILAQAILESSWGKSRLAKEGKNLFGIKGSYLRESVTMRTAEYNAKKEKYYVDTAFKKYPSWYDSLYDLAILYQNGVSWDRNKYKKVVGEKDYKIVAQFIQEAGYATDPDYASKLIKIIQVNNLTRYDIVSYPLLKFGSRGVNVEKIQRLLDVKVDGIFGVNTLTAVKAFQKEKGLVEDGIVGKDTWEKMSMLN